MDRQQYAQFVEALRTAETTALPAFEREEAKFFEGCMPIEQIAKRGERGSSFWTRCALLAFLTPIQLKRPYAVVQLRQDNVGSGHPILLVGFQTNIRYGKQQEILQMIPGLETSRICSFWSNAPQHLDQLPHFTDGIIAIQSEGRFVFCRTNHRCRGLCW
jgi:methylenetetrahydrofolate--tRNA-(uracil-5-)-methyltransferase